MNLLEKFNVDLLLIERISNCDVMIRQVDCGEKAIYDRSYVRVFGFIEHIRGVRLATKRIQHMSRSL